MQCDLQFTLRVKPGHSRERKNDTATLKERYLCIKHISFLFLCPRETPYFAQDHVPVFSIKKILLGKLKPLTSVFLL